MNRTITFNIFLIYKYQSKAISVWDTIIPWLDYELRLNDFAVSQHKLYIFGINVDKIILLMEYLENNNMYNDIDIKTMEQYI